MNIFLEVAARLGGADGTQFFHWRLQEFGDVVLDLLAKAGISQSLAQGGLLDVGESAAQRTFHNVVIHHGTLVLGESRRGAAPRLTALLLEGGDGFRTVTGVAEDCDWGHRKVVRQSEH